MGSGMWVSGGTGPKQLARRAAGSLRGRAQDWLTGTPVGSPIPGPAHLRVPRTAAWVKSLSAAPGFPAWLISHMWMFSNSVIGLSLQAPEL